jgi:hypothetical protein
MGCGMMVKYSETFADVEGFKPLSIYSMCMLIMTCVDTLKPQKTTNIYSPLAALTVALASLERARSAGPNLYRMNGMKVNKVAMRAKSRPAY